MSDPAGNAALLAATVLAAAIVCAGSTAGACILLIAALREIGIPGRTAIITYGLAGNIVALLITIVDLQRQAPEWSGPLLLQSIGTHLATAAFWPIIGLWYLGAMLRL